LGIPQRSSEVLIRENLKFRIMPELTLEWQEAGRLRKETIRHQQPSKYPGTIRLGRDPARSDLVLSDLTVSGLHVEIFFNPSTQLFCLRNLRATNPPLVNGRQIFQGEVPLTQGSTIFLGQVALNVTAVSLALSAPSIAPTILVSPQALGVVNQPVPDAVSYGLQCPKCRRVSPYDRMDLGCPWCGTSLAAAASVLMAHNGN
jgi:ssDNA-binding Zn-finger/Zn-ribbon topoisomerase 1